MQEEIQNAGLVSTDHSLEAWKGQVGKWASGHEVAELIAESNFRSTLTLVAAAKQRCEKNLLPLVTRPYSWINSLRTRLLCRTSGLNRTLSRYSKFADPLEDELEMERINELRRTWLVDS